MSDIEQKVKEIQDAAVSAILGADGLDRLNEVRVSFLGKKGSLTAVLKSMKNVDPEDRPKVGKWVNDARAEIEARMTEMKNRLDAEKMARELEKEKIDVTLPPKMKFIGHSHPNTIALEEVEFRRTIRRRTSRTPSISQKIFFSVRRHRRYRPVSWRRVSSRSV